MTEARYIALQRRLNDETRPFFAAYAAHRRRVTDLILKSAASESRPTLTLLGAGNCNDVDLLRLSGTFQHIQLIDIDETALAWACETHRTAALTGLVADIAGVADLVDGVDRQASAPPSASDVEARVSRRTVVFPNTRRASVVVSLCMYTQVLGAVRSACTGTESAHASCARALLSAHLRTLIGLLRPSGTAIVVTDMVSSDTCLALNAPECDPAAIAQHCLATGDFFLGTHPATLLQEVHRSPELNRAIAGIQFLTPWTWQLTTRTYLVYAVRLRRCNDQREGL